MKFEDFKKVQTGEKDSCGRFNLSYSITTGKQYCDYMDERGYIKFEVSEWCRFRGINWRDMTEEDFNLMVFEYEIKRKNNDTL